MSADCEVLFYHLERSTLEEVLPELLTRTLQRGGRALVRSPSQDRLTQLDEWLWTYRSDAFLPHGLEDEPYADRQPVLLSMGMTNANQASVLFLLDGAETGPLAGFERCVVLFDGGDPPALTAARKSWTAVKASGLRASYHRQTANGWEKQA